MEGSNSGISIMQNTIVRGLGANGQPGKKMKLGIREKNEKEKEKRRKISNYIKKGRRGLKNASFWAITSKNFAGGSLDPR